MRRVEGVTFRAAFLCGLQGNTTGNTSCPLLRKTSITVYNRHRSENNDSDEKDDALRETETEISICSYSVLAVEGALDAVLEAQGDMRGLPVEVSVRVEEERHERRRRRRRVVLADPRQHHRPRHAAQKTGSIRIQTTAGIHQSDVPESAGELVVVVVHERSG